MPGPGGQVECKTGMVVQVEQDAATARPAVQQEAASPRPSSRRESNPLGKGFVEELRSACTQAQETEVGAGPRAQGGVEAAPAVGAAPAAAQRERSEPLAIHLSEAQLREMRELAKQQQQAEALTAQEFRDKLLG